MTPLQLITLRASEIRQRLSELGGIAELSDENRAEIDRLRVEYQDIERRSQALTIAEDAPERIETRSEDRELRDLERRSNVGEMFDAVLSHRDTDGAISELQQHHGLDVNQIPLALLSGDELETRAVTPAPADVGQNQQPIIPYVFPQGAAAFLAVAQPTVAVGEAVFPVLTSELSVEALAENAAGTETTGAFSADVLSPARLQAAFFYSREDRARFAGMDAALRQNLSDGLSDGLDKQVIAGDNGLLGSSGLTAPDAPTTTANFAAYRSLIYDSAVIDGRYASGAADVRVLLGAETYAHAASVYRGNNADDSALDSLMRVAGGLRVSAHVPAAASDDQALIVRKGGRMDAVAPIWEGVTIIPDEVTKAANGQIVITAVLLHAVKILRTDGFARKAVQLA